MVEPVIPVCCEHEMPLIIACPKCHPEKYVITQKMMDSAREAEAQWHKDVLKERNQLQAKTAELQGLIREIIDSARGRTMAPEIRDAIQKAARLLAS